MLDGLRRLFSAPPARDEDPERRLHLAAAVLLVETARADWEIRPEERAELARLVGRTFGLGEAESAELVAVAQAAAEEAVSLYEDTRILNERWSAQEKARVIELMWRVAYADGRIDKYEEHFIRRVAELLHVPHREFIRAKHAAARGQRP